MLPRVKKLSSAKEGLEASMLTGQRPGSLVPFWDFSKASPILWTAS